MLLTVRCVAVETCVPLLLFLSTWVNGKANQLLTESGIERMENIYTSVNSQQQINFLNFFKDAEQKGLIVIYWSVVK